MQNWKIKRMSEKRIKVWLDAVAFVLSCYEKNRKFKVCPFCEIVKRQLCEMDSCRNCLWQIIENRTCVDFRYDEIGGESPVEKIRNGKKWKMLRIPQLKKWKKILKAELARRK